MKKKVTIRTTAKASPRKTTRKTSSGGQSILFQRIVIISACLTLFVVGGVIVNKRSVGQAVEGASITKGLYMQATVQMPNDVPQATYYNIYYKTSSEKTFTNAVRRIPTNVTTYTISRLKKGVSYVYRYAAVNAEGREILFSQTLPLTNLQPM